MSSHRGTVEGFFLAGQNLVWCKIGASLFASSIGIVRFLTLAGSGASAGVVIGAIEWNAVFFLCALGWIFSPIYIKAEVVTMPEFLRKRFCSRRIQFLLSFLYLFFYIFHMLLVEICIGSMYLRLIWGLDTYLITIFLLLIAGACTITGGLVTVAYTDTLHATMISTGSVLVMTFALRKVGGFRNIVDNYFTAKPNITSEGNWTAKPECYTPRQDSLHIFRDVKTGDIPWPGLIFGVPIISLFHWCNNQIFVQRALAGKDMNHVKGGCVFCGFLKLLTMFSIVIPGMISRILFPDQIACVVPSECEKHCGNKSNCSFLAYPLLILELLPLGLRGFIMSTLWAALISSLTSAFNCSSTIFTMDIYTQMRPMATEKELMVTGSMYAYFPVFHFETPFCPAYLYETLT
ncbi:sodium/glucose cotransporter 1-like, partial [Erinaceus europaeus]|uniref:Sodium/glucose cotransporter 1-like n=1 Tax=Erinaceus europaeus TaxID=9365 RepID=A0ABM3WTD4_ERIEU